MTSRKLVLIVCVLCVGVAFMVGQAKPPETDAGGTEAALMRAKLASSQKVVEGLMTPDLTLGRTGALELEKICDATEWHAKEDQVYAHYRAELQRTAKKLLNDTEDSTLAIAIELEGHCYSRLRQSNDFKEGVEAFHGKRAAKFIGS